MTKYFLTLTFTLLFSFFCYAQQPVPTPPPPVKEDSDVVKISTQLIQIDVSVTDSKGQPVKDIRPEEVEIYENGKRQEITNFSFISAVNEKTVTASSKTDKNQAALPPAMTPTRPEQIRRTIALVVDDLTLSFESTHFVRRALKKFVDEQMQDGDLVAIIRTGAGVGALQQFTTDRRQLYAAIEKVKWNPVGSGGISAFAPLEATPLERSKSMGADISDEQLQAEKENIAAFNNFREDVFATGTLGAIDFVICGMGELPGRKAIMLLSDGFSLYSQVAGGFTEQNRVLNSLRRLVDLANRSSVVIYTMDARGLAITGLTAADDTNGIPADKIEERLAERRDKLFNTQEGLIYVARQTGGFAVINNNDLSGGIRKILDDQSYYLVGYQPDDEIFDPAKRRFNNLIVKVNRKNVKVRYRSGFFGITDEQMEKLNMNLTAEQRITRALTSPFAAADIPLKLNAVFGNESKQGSFIRSFLHIDAENIVFTDLPDGKKKAVFDILAVGFGDNGNPIDQISKTFTANISETFYREIKARGLVYDFVFPIKKPGAIQLRVAIHDKTTGKVGSANQFIEVPNLKKERLSLSGIILENMKYEDWKKAAQGANKNSVPPTDPISDSAFRKFKRGSVLNYGLEIYNAKSESGKKTDLSVQSKLFLDGKLIFEGKPQPWNISSPDMSRIRFTNTISLGTAMAPGEYILQVVVTDNLAKKKRQIATQFVSFEVTN